MFELREDVKFIQTTPDNIVAIIESINQPMIAARGGAAEPAKAYIVGVRNSSGLFSIYVYLYLVRVHQCLVYLHDPVEIPMESYHDTELDALGFVESMGFIVDNMNFRKMDPQQQSQLMMSLPCFHSDLEAFAKQQGEEENNSMTEINDDSAALDLTPLEDDIMELEEVAEDVIELTSPIDMAVDEQGIAKIVRLLSSF